MSQEEPKYVTEYGSPIGSTGNGRVHTTDPAGHAPVEPRALRRLREARRLEERLKREREAYKTGGPPPSRW